MITLTGIQGIEGEFFARMSAQTDAAIKEILRELPLDMSPEVIAYELQRGLERYYKSLGKENFEKYVRALMNLE